MRVKICGITRIVDAQAAASAGAWAIGLNFYRRSPRYIEPTEAAIIADALPPEIERVGVFVNTERREVERIAEAAQLTMIQFHGDEQPDFCRGWRWPTIKALRLRQPPDIDLVAAYGVDFILADAYVEGTLGGTGRTVDRQLVSLLGNVCGRERLILAGGLTPDNVAEAVREARPHAVDVASGVESSPGKKDPALIRRFIDNAKLA